MNKAITTGVLGSILGVEATLVGIVWSMLYYDYARIYDFTVTFQNLPTIYPDLLVHPCIPASLNVHLGDLRASFVWFTLILAVVLILNLILTGVGLHGLGKIKRKALGAISFVVGVAGAISAIILLLLGVVTGDNTLTFTSLIAPSLITQHPIQFIILAGGVPQINTSLLWLGLIIVGITIIVFGAVFINLREGLDNPRLSLATGILATVAGIILLTGVLLPWLAFIVLSITFISATLVFFQSREMA